MAVRAESRRLTPLTPATPPPGGEGGKSSAVSYRLSVSMVARRHGTAKNTHEGEPGKMWENLLNFGFSSTKTLNVQRWTFNSIRELTLHFDVYKPNDPAS